MTLETEVSALPKIGSITTAALKKLHITTVRDLLLHFPQRYLDFSKTIQIIDAREGETVTIRGKLKDISLRRSFRSRLTICEGIISDDSGSIKILWFNQPYLAKTLRKGEELLLSGKVERYKSIQLVNPVYERISEESIHTGRLVPVYRANDSIPIRTLRTLIHSCLNLVDEIIDEIPKNIQKVCGLIPLNEAIKQLHFPNDTADVPPARFRIAFDDVFPQQMAVLLQQAELLTQKSYIIKTDIELVKSFLKTLPFTLTASQKKAAWDILKDIETSGPMNRLLQGDVGSGKTIVALLAMVQTAEAQLQSTLLAPTEILAVQHFETIKNIAPKNLRIGLLTRNFSTIGGESITKTAFIESLSEGEIDIAIGTHALIQDQIAFKNLGLVVIDEQHRFGVAQRSLLAMQFKKIRPHLLSMSATPIPRTLALSIFANLSVSTLKQVPSGRKPIITRIVNEQDRNKAYDFIRNQIDQGRQAFVITPRVEETIKSDVRSVKVEHKRLSEKIFSNYKVGLVYGSLKGVDKDVAMQRFNAKEDDILVATSVIEIGIDIPNASVIIIEGAERFGLAQLHQLRGRVGRGPHQSYCFLFTTDPSQSDNERLKVFSQSNDGFNLAEMDLKQRGFGDLLGRQQTGYAFKYPQWISIPALHSARKGAELLLEQDPLLNSTPELKQIANAFKEDFHGE